jgi:Transcription factor WhiB
VVGLLAEILRRIPRLPGALCAGRPADFDCHDGVGIEAAKALCHRCPALSACRTWTQTRRRGELVGVIAGEYYKAKPWNETAKNEGTRYDKL